MHELSLCQGMVDTILDELTRVQPPPTRVTKTRIVVGRLHQIVPETMELAYEVTTRDTPLEGSSLELSHIPIRARCSACGQEQEVEQALFLCSACGTTGLEILSGKELYIESFEVEDEDGT